MLSTRFISEPITVDFDQTAVSLTFVTIVFPKGKIGVWGLVFELGNCASWC